MADREPGETPMMAEPTALPMTDEAAGAVVDAMMQLLGIPIAPEWRGAIVANVKAAAAAARLVLAVTLDDELEPAPVFRA